MYNVLDSNSSSTEQALDNALKQGLIIWLSKLGSTRNFYVSSFLKDYRQFQGQIGDSNIKMNLADLFGPQAGAPAPATDATADVLAKVVDKLDTIATKIGA